MKCWKEAVLDDANFSAEMRNAKLFLYSDSFLSRNIDRSSPSITVVAIGIYNLPPHLRHMPGLNLPVILIKGSKGKKLPTMDHVLQLPVDEIR